MKTYVALIRGINVGGRNSLPMAALVELLEALDLEDVRTYIQSGNIVFRSRKTRAALAKLIPETIGKDRGFTPETLILTAEELQQAAHANPFPEGETDPQTLHLFFLAAPPGESSPERLEAARSGREQFALEGSVFYLHAPDGIGRSKLAANAERLLGVPATARNWRTVTKLIELATKPPHGG